MNFNCSYNSSLLLSPQSPSSWQMQAPQNWKTEQTAICFLNSFQTYPGLHIFTWFGCLHTFGIVSISVLLFLFIKLILQHLVIWPHSFQIQTLSYMLKCCVSIIFNNTMTMNACCHIIVMNYVFHLWHTVYRQLYLITV